MEFKTCSFEERRTPLSARCRGERAGRERNREPTVLFLHHHVVHVYRALHEVVRAVRIGHRSEAVHAVVVDAQDHRIGHIHARAFRPELRPVFAGLLRDGKCVVFMQILNQNICTFSGRPCGARASRSSRAPCRTRPCRSRARGRRRSRTRRTPPARAGSWRAAARRSCG